MKEQFILSIKIENLDKDYSKQIILDDFNSFEEINEWAEWLKEVYNKVKEKR